MIPKLIQICKTSQITSTKVGSFIKSTMVEYEEQLIKDDSLSLYEKKTLYNNRIADFVEVGDFNFLANHFNQN